MSTESTNPDLSRMRALAVNWTAAQPVVAAFIAGVIPHHHDAEDVLQRTAASLVAMYDQYDPAQPFARWAMGVAKIEILRYRQERGRERASFDTETVEAISVAFENAPVAHADTRQAIDRCIGKLAGRVREIFELHYRDSLAPSLIAQRLARTQSAVFVALHRGRLAVRKCLEKQLQIGSAS